MIKTDIPQLDPETLLARLRAELRHVEQPAQVRTDQEPPAVPGLSQDVAAQETLSAAAEAEKLTTVRTRLPKFLNPLFRPQNRINRSFLRGLRALAEGHRRGTGLARWLADQTEGLRYNQEKLRARIAELEETVRLQGRQLEHLIGQTAANERPVDHSAGPPPGGTRHI